MKHNNKMGILISMFLLSNPEFKGIESLPQTKVARKFEFVAKTQFLLLLKYTNEFED